MVNYIYTQYGKLQGDAYFYWVIFFIAVYGLKLCTNQGNSSIKFVAYNEEWYQIKSWL